VSNVKLVIADVDGTLVTQEKVLTARAKESVQKVRDAGLHFTITSGRPPRGMKVLIDELQLTDPIAGFNGGVFVHPDLSVITQRFIPADVARNVFDMIKSHQLDVWVYTEKDWFIRDPNAPHVAREQWTVKFPPVVSSDLESQLGHAVKLVGVSDDLEAVARCEKDVQQAVGNHASAARSQPYYLDVTHPDANKGAVVMTLSEMLHIPRSEIVTVGDMPNDVLMFNKSGVSIAMGNASPEVQKSAKFVTGSNEQEGFAEAMEKFVLGTGK
jgi:Cof subfamily protein (haloacid dehalogenase superfamily)